METRSTALSLYGNALPRQISSDRKYVAMQTLRNNIAKVRDYIEQEWAYSKPTDVDISHKFSELFTHPFVAGVATEQGKFYSIDASGQLSTSYRYPIFFPPSTTLYSSRPVVLATQSVDNGQECACVLCGIVSTAYVLTAGIYYILNPVTGAVEPLVSTNADGCVGLGVALTSNKLLFFPEPGHGAIVYAPE